MYSIVEMSRGFTAFTLRYYEKVGVLPGPSRHNGIRRYDEQALTFIRFIHGLKETGMGLEDIADKVNIHVMLKKRLRLLEQHISKLDQHMKQLESIKAVAQEKMAFYSELLQE